MIKAIRLNEIKIPLWVRLIPFSRCSYAKRQIGKVLASRDIQEVEKAWENVGISYERITSILNIIAKYCDWKSIHFIPSDECSCLLMDHDLELGVIVAISEIEKTCPRIRYGQLYEYLNPNRNLLDLIRFLLGEFE